MLWHELVSPVDHHITLVTSMFCQGDIINKCWALIGNRSTLSVLWNQYILSNIHKVNQEIHISWNSEGKKVKHKSLLTNYNEWLWYHFNGISNIHSLVYLCKRFNFTFNGERGELHVNLYSTQFICNFILWNQGQWCTLIFTDSWRPKQLPWK